MANSDETTLALQEGGNAIAFEIHHEGASVHIYLCSGTGKISCVVVSFKTQFARFHAIPFPDITVDEIKTQAELLKQYNLHFQCNDDALYNFVGVEKDNNGKVIRRSYQVELTMALWISYGLGILKTYVGESIDNNRKRLINHAIYLLAYNVTSWAEENRAITFSPRR